MHYYVDSCFPVAVSMKPKTGNEKALDVGKAHSVIFIGYKNPGTTFEKEHLQKFVVEHGIDQTVFLIDAADFFKDYIIMNDNTAPYAKVEFSDTSSPVIDEKNSCELGFGKMFNANMLVVPLAKRMFLEALDAKDIVSNIISDVELGYKAAMEDTGRNILKELDIGSKENPIIFRLLLVTGSSLKRKRCISFAANDYAKNIYTIIPLPKFVWICETLL